MVTKTVKAYLRNNGIESADCKRCIKLVWRAATEASDALKIAHNKQTTPCLECSEWRVNRPFITYCPNCGRKYE